MDLQLNGRKAIVTGGSRGIGKAIARALALEGCDVAICARSQEALDATAAELAKETGRTIVPITCDLLDPASITTFVNRAAETMGGLQIVVNNGSQAGGRQGNVETVSPEDVLLDVEEKVVGYLRVVQAAAPYMKAAGWGRVINISGGINRSPGSAIAGPVREISTVTMTKAMANGLGQYGITVNCVTPGLTLTEKSLERHKATAQKEGVSLDTVLGRVADRTAIKHLITAEDVANVVTFICSPLAVSITGESIATMGGSSQDVHV
jgi:NAD(P)-dependent dehydrogenase (short-subunit alcohol dehydrogenase family)